jgi:hypothetical protein
MHLRSGRFEAPSTTGLPIRAGCVYSRSNRAPLEARTRFPRTCKHPIMTIVRGGKVAQSCAEGGRHGFFVGRDCGKLRLRKAIVTLPGLTCGGIFMRRKSCEAALLGLTWLGYMLQIFLIALSALWVDIGVASEGPVRVMIPNPEKKYSVGENAGKSLGPRDLCHREEAARQESRAWTAGSSWTAGSCRTAGARGCSGNARPTRSCWACGPR